MTLPENPALVPPGRKITKAVMCFPTGTLVFQRSKNSGNYYYFEDDGTGKTHREGFPSRWVFEVSFYELLEKARNCGYEHRVFYNEKYKI